MKPYKAASPQDTIYRIRTILYDLGIFVTEQHVRNAGMYYSCRVFLDNDDMKHCDIGTNGKGMNAEYALASAYAELMERIENKMLIYATKYASHEFRRHNKELDANFIPALRFRYFPDEVFREISANELWEHCQQILPNVAKYGKRDIQRVEKYAMYYADFYNVNKDVVELLPYHLIRLAASSTGLCAGNTPEEAMLQGLNEIFERYVLQQLYLQGLTPPTIPIEMFEGTEIYKRLKQLQVEKGWVVEVKDCSLGKDFPVLGLLLIDRANNRYTFRLGADLSPVIALQRCFTEAFQGADASERYLQPIMLDDGWDIQVEHNQSVVNGLGRFPRQLFYTKSSWEFRGFQMEGQATHKDDLMYIKQWLEKDGYTLYVRDNSFLGFPAYHLFIPGLSEIDAKLYDVIADLRSNNEIFFKVKSEYRLQTLDSEEIMRFLDKYKNSATTEIRLFPYNASKYNRLNRCLLLALLSYAVGKNEDAYHYMNDFLEEKVCEGNRQIPYYYCVRDMFYAKSRCDNNTEIVSMLATIYSEELVKEVLADMNDRANVLKNFPLPVCFNCDKCNIKNSCSYLTILDLERRLQTVQEKCVIKQEHLRFVFN